MIELIVAHPHAFWLSLGGLLLARRCWAATATCSGAVLPPSLPVFWSGSFPGLGVAGALFAVLTLVAAWLWWRWLNRRVNEQKPLDAHLNQRGQQIVGKRFTLDTALVNGRGHMRVGDSSWPVVADDDLSAGTRVEVIAVEGITLRVKPVKRGLAMAAAGKIIDNRAVGAVIPGQDSASCSSCSRIACSSMMWRSISATFSSVRFFTSAL
jgi:membrane protein implicated in regulation of membrane protease activity